MLALCCCTRFSLGTVSGGYSVAAVRQLLIAVTSLVAEFKFWGSTVASPGLQRAGSIVVAQGLIAVCGPWDLPRPGIEPESPALAGEFLTPEPPGKGFKPLGGF